MNKTSPTNLIIFRPQGSTMVVDVTLKDDTVWLTQADMFEPIPKFLVHTLRTPVG